MPIDYSSDVTSASTADQEWVDCPDRKLSGRSRCGLCISFILVVPQPFSATYKSNPGRMSCLGYSTEQRSHRRTCSGLALPLRRRSKFMACARELLRSGNASIVAALATPLLFLICLDRMLTCTSSSQHSEKSLL